MKIWENQEDKKKYKEWDFILGWITILDLDKWCKNMVEVGDLRIITKEYLIITLMILKKTIILQFIMMYGEILSEVMIGFNNNKEEKNKIN